MANNYKVFALLGRAGCGKGTQAKLLKDKFGLFYIGSGEMLRDLAQSPSFTGQKVNQVLNQGGFVPTFVIFKLWLEKLEKIKKEMAPDFSGIIFDGSPRKIMEAKMMDDALDWFGWSENFKPLLINISRQEAFDRLTKRRQCRQCGQLIPYVGDYKNLTKCDKCGGELVVRQDDTPQAINQRLDLFETEVTPVIKYYEESNRIIKINGEQSIEAVHQEILNKIND